jgi:processive 1,2-diacylglycerol beta-glucosyltransferase
MKKPCRTNSGHIRKKILVSGGSSGLGNILEMLNEVKETNRFDYVVLCENNQKLYQEISSWKLAHINPVPYLSSRTDMNTLYDQVDAVITKPGGVTVSEALQKRLPIFINFCPSRSRGNQFKVFKTKGSHF